jgi:hypothetical protein
MKFLEWRPGITKMGITELTVAVWPWLPKQLRMM